MEYGINENRECPYSVLSVDKIVTAKNTQRKDVLMRELA